MAESSEDYAQAHADQYREKGNGLFKAGDYAGAVGAYSEAIALDPANHAFKDAEQCVALKPDWPKSYSRRGAAEHALGRFVAAQTSYRKALELAPETPAPRPSGSGKEEEEAAAREELGDFFSALDDDAVARKRAKKAETNPTTEKYATQKLGKGADQIARLTPSHHAFKNLNPFHVLDLDVDATPDDIKARYRKLSALTHPDKNGGADDARRAFEYVKDAYLELSDEKKRAKTVLIVEGARRRCRDERALQVEKGIVDGEDELPPLDGALAKEVLKTFAQNEMKRRDVEDHHRVQANRDREHEEAAKKKDADEKAFEKQWNDDDRRADRIDFWQQFQDDAKRATNVKRQRGAVNFKREAKVEKKPKYGQADMESRKREWK
ncbi:hypothetical protein JL721_8483 [Aureococcus anophagefferens]|nr:hypothetical protein JL721_8483 [Aureococcus anophagefferens]